MRSGDGKRGKLAENSESPLQNISQLDYALEDLLRDIPRRTTPLSKKDYAAIFRDKEGLRALQGGTAGLTGRGNIPVSTNLLLALL